MREKKNTLLECQCIQKSKVLIGDIIFISPIGDGTVMLRGHPNHAKVQPLVVQRDYPSQLFIEDLESGTVPGIEPATSRREVKRSTYSAKPARSNHP